MRKPLVSVAMITYGHEAYIVAAIAGVFEQEYDGEIEFIIADDKSPDKTEEVINSFIANNPPPAHIKLRYIRHEQNKGMLSNFIWSLSVCTGKYIAVCEGDDFWTDPLKIQKQVDFLEDHTAYAIVFSNVHILVERSQNNTGGKLIGIKKSGTYNGAQILRSWVAHTSTYLFRNGTHIQGLGDFFAEYKFIYGDTPLFLYILEKGKAFGMDDFTSTYRRHEAGITSEKEDYESALRYVNHLKELNRAFNNQEYHTVNDHLIAVTYYNLFRNRNLNFGRRIKYLLDSIRYEPLLLFKIITEKIT